MALPGHPFQKIFGVLKAIAPTAVAGLGGPFAPLIGAAMKKVMGNQAMSDAEVETAVLNAAANPDQLLKLKEIEAAAKQHEQDLGVRFEELAIQREGIEAGDRKNARDLALVHGSKLLTPQNMIAALFICGYFTMLGLFFSKHLEEPMSDVFKVLVGVLTAAIPQILGFFFGSTSSSQVKTALLAKDA